MSTLDAIGDLVSKVENWEQACTEVADAISELQDTEDLERVMNHDDFSAEDAESLAWVIANDPNMNPPQEMFGEVTALAGTIETICDELDAEDDEDDETPTTGDTP